MWKLIGWIIPGTQIPALLASLASLMVTAIKAVMEGLSVSIANPVVFIIIGSAFVGGLYEGVRWDRRKVEAVQAELTRLRGTWEAADAESKERLARALDAKAKAEKEAANAAARAGRDLARRVPNAAPAAGNSGQSVFGFPSVFTKN